MPTYMKKKRYYKAHRRNKRRPRGAFAKRKRRRAGKRRRCTPLEKTRAFRKLKRRVEAGMGTYVYKTRSTEALEALANQIGSKVFDGSKIGFIQSAIDNLPTYNPANPASYTFVNFNTGSNQKRIEIANTYTYVQVKSNYQVPVRVKIYLCIPREDTNITPQQALINGLADVSEPDLTEVSPMISPFDSPQFNDLWKVAKTTKKLLLPGKTVSASHVIGSFLYDPSFIQSHALDYQGRYGSHAYFVRVEGALAHDTVVTTEQGNSNAGVEVQRFTKYLIKYEAGADIKFIEVVDGNDSFSNTPVQTVLQNENQANTK